MSEAVVVREGARRWLTVLWPSFVMAGVTETLVFGFVDPGDLHDLSHLPLDASPLAIYSIAFLAFWAVIAGACLMTQRLDDPG